MFYISVQKTLSSLELPRAVLAANTSISISPSISNENPERIDAGASEGTLSTSQYVGRQRQKFNDPARDLSIQVLEKFSLVTKFARDTTSQIFRESHSNNGFNANDWRNRNQSSLDNSVSEESQKVSNGNIVTPDPLEVTFCFLEQINY